MVSSAARKREVRRLAGKLGISYTAALRHWEQAQRHGGLDALSPQQRRQVVPSWADRAAAGFAGGLVDSDATQISGLVIPDWLQDAEVEAASVDPNVPVSDQLQASYEGETTLQLVECWIELQLRGWVHRSHLVRVNDLVATALDEDGAEVQVTLRPQVAEARFPVRLEADAEIWELCDDGVEVVWLEDWIS